MPLATLQFNLPDDQCDFSIAVKGAKYRSTLQEYDSWLRALTKYGDNTPIEPKDARSKLWEILAANDADDILE
jgi:hypothetical protein